MYSMDPWAIMNTQEIWAQPSPPPTSTVVTNVMMMMVSRRIDSCVTAGSNPKPSPSLLLLPSSPCSPSTDGPLAWPMAISTNPNVTLTATKSGWNEWKYEGRRLLGVSDKTEQMGRKKQGEWLENHRLDPGKSPPQMTLMIVSKTMCSAPSGNNHPVQQSVMAQELKLSCRTREECQAARNQMYGPTQIKGVVHPGLSQ